MSDSVGSDDAPEGVDPREFVRAVLGISPEDAEKVRQRTPATPARTRRKNADGAQDGPTGDYGSDSGAASR